MNGEERKCLMWEAPGKTVSWLLIVFWRSPAGCVVGCERDRAIDVRVPTCLTCAFRLRPSVCALKLSRVREGAITGAAGGAGATGTIRPGIGAMSFPPVGSIIECSRGNGRKRWRVEDWFGGTQNPMVYPCM
jgi:hypothetical protein